MSDNEEGFVQDQPTQIIEYNYQPSSRAWTMLSKKTEPLFKRENNYSLIMNPCSRLINTSIHDEWVNTLIATNHPKNVVFSAYSKTTCNFQENNVTFSSEFESGNLEIVSRIRNNEYELFMKPDSNTKNHFQWFYFKVNVRKGNRTIKFIIKNFIKATMLYSKGLKPYCRSLKNPDFHQFKQINQPVKFSQDPYAAQFTLQFEHHFEQDDDQVQFCSQPPYSLQYLNKFIDTLRCKKLTLGMTVMGNKIPYLIFEAKKQTKAVAIVMARQHPGESVASWMMQGFLNQVAERNLNEYITWVIIPMLNVDGVILGNNRTGILGHDFNRNWIVEQVNSSSSRHFKLFPEISAVLSLIRTLKRKYPRKVKMFLDFHGHSSQPNVFSYGPPHEQHSEYFYQCRLYPELIAKKNPNFKLSQCSYVLHAQKRQTARAVFFYNLGVPFTYTIESTFGVMNDKNVGIDEFIKMGEDAALCAHEFLHVTVLKQNGQSLNTFIQDIKAKYADSNNEGQQFDSASDASDENPNRIKIEEMVIANQISQVKCQTSGLKFNKRYEQQKIQTLQQRSRFQSVGKCAAQTQKQPKYFSKQKNHGKRRVNTQIQLVINKKQCIFPTIGTKNSKLGFDQMSFGSNDEIFQSLKINDLQRRLQKLRNSKIGKKILVINAYCS